MLAWKVVIRMFLICQVAALFFVALLSWSLARDLFWSIVFTPQGITNLIAHGYPPWVATRTGIFGGIVMTVNFWSISYYGLEHSVLVRRIACWLHKDEPSAPVRRVNNGWIGYLSIFGLCLLDIGVAVGMACVSRLNKWTVLVLALVMSALRNLVIGGSIGFLSHRYPLLMHNLRMAGLLFFLLTLFPAIIKKRRLLGHLLHRDQKEPHATPKLAPEAVIK